MASVDDIKAIANQVWPNAASIDVHPGAAAMVGLHEPDPSGFRVIATSVNNKIIEQLAAPTLEELRVLLDLRLTKNEQKPT
jgi:hypothetical protein